MKTRTDINKSNLNRVVYGILFISLLILSLSCSSRQSYDVLTIFFDDVPLPDSTKTVKDSTNLAAKDTSAVKPAQNAAPEITHPPAEEDGCNNCHDIGNSFALTETPPKLCYTCHDDFNKKFVFKHGPVIIGSCTVCHDPHKSKFSSLLKIDDQNLCYYCHEKESVMKNDIHSDIGETKCWDCHNPHGGSDRTFMK